MKETKKQRLSIRQRVNTFHEVFVYPVSVVQILSRPNANYSWRKRCESLRGVLIPCKCSFMFQNFKSNQI